MTIVVRAAEPVDYPEIARLTVAAYRTDGQLAGDVGRSYAPVLADVASRAAAGELLVAVDRSAQSVALGSVLFVLPGTPYAELSRPPDEAEFRMLAVDPAAQGRGVGEALVRACLDRARQGGARAVVICVRSFSAPAHRLYARLGFVREPERDWSPLPGVDLLALRRDLPNRENGENPENRDRMNQDPPAPRPVVGQSEPIRSSSS